uniref:Uncharacterized protein n=1 Tax=Setaria viridis TaxID=4556 RepID=A0A4U6V389_SETVI|nr:hypothetical protein SEVIR_4G173100v2 [Setaria viridis]
MGFLSDGLEAARWFEVVAPLASPRLPPAATVLEYVRRRPRKQHMLGLLHQGGIRYLLLSMFISRPEGQHLWSLFFSQAPGWKFSNQWCFLQIKNML